MRRYPASIVKEYAWCPVAAWLAANLGIAPQPTPRMLEGREEHRRLRELLAEIGYPDAHPLPPLPSKTYPLIATPDAYSPSRNTLIEVKRVARLNQRLYRVQALVYALIATENGIRVDKVLLYNTENNEKIIIEVDAWSLQTARKIIENALRVIQEPIPPPVTQPPQKCRACRWRRHCPEAAQNKL